jgi:hypothetical protein
MIFKALPFLLKHGVPVLMIATALLFAYHWGRASEAVQAEAELNAERAVLAEQAAARESEYRATENRLNYELMQVSTNAEQLAQSTRADLVAAADNADRLQERAEQLAASCRATVDDTAAAYSRDAADAAGRMLALMLRRVEDHGRRVVAFADSAHIAGSTCNLDYNAVREASMNIASDHEE